MAPSGSTPLVSPSLPLRVSLSTDGSSLNDISVKAATSKGCLFYHLLAVLEDCMQAMQRDR